MDNIELFNLNKKEVIKMKKEIMSPERLSSSLSIQDLTDSKNGIHAINIVVKKIEETIKNVYKDSLSEEYRIDPVVTISDNYDRLLFPVDNAGRSSRYTRYVDNEHVLRTHTSAAIPVWLEKAKKEQMEDRIVFIPGICYRRDVVDKTHCGEPHQLEIWRVKKGAPRLERKDLINLIENVLNSVVPGYKYRANEMKHPYTINGLEVEVLVGNEWMEILECGEIHPTILQNAGYDLKEYSGLAMGMGLDRLVMIIKGIDDIRVLRSQDSRIKEQLTNLDKYIPVSNQPPTKRVISYSSSSDKTEEDICETIRDTLGSNASFLEKVQVEEVSYNNLEEKARENLGISPDQKNIVAKLTFRSLEGSLPKKTVNKWMEDIYPKLNEGSRGYM
jgi:phenylalanyl-tRNA synthetase alpha chain